MIEKLAKIFTCRMAVALLGVVMSAACVFSQGALDSKEREELIDSVTSAYEDWSRASISGKLKMEGLPLSLSVKIFMERDSSVMISLRAPFMGEVGRAEICADTLLVVNKMKKTYVKEPLSVALAYYPGNLTDVQNLLLSRPIIAGYGLLRPETAEFVEVYRETDGGYSLLPVADMAPEGYDYGYLIDDAARVAALLVVPLAKPDTAVSLTYVYRDKGYDLTVGYQSGDKSKSGTLELDYPDWTGNPMEPVKLNGRYRRLSFPEFMKSF